MMMKEMIQKRRQKIPVIFGVKKLAVFVRCVCNEDIVAVLSGVTLWSHSGELDKLDDLGEWEEWDEMGEFGELDEFG